MRWIQERLQVLKSKGKSQAGLAAVLNVRPARVTEMIYGHRRLQSSEVGKLAAYLEMSQTEVLDRINNANALDSLPDDALTDRLLASVSRLAGLPQIPVWASSAVLEHGVMKLDTKPIEWIQRSDRLRGVKDAFAFYNVGTAMSPAIEHADQVIVNPAVPVRAGIDCVFLQEVPDGTLLGAIRRPIGLQEQGWTARQFNPPSDTIMPSTRWSKVYAVAEIKRGGL